MTDRERLIELLVNFNPYKDPIRQMADRMIIEKIADYLLANGVIVPPCKVGDTVYFLERHPERFGGTKINTAEVVRMKLTVSHKGMSIWLFVTYRDINGNDTCGEIMYGKTVFLTKEEAEEKLKELGK